MTIYEAIHTENDYHETENVYAHAYRDSLYIVDLENAMKPGRECRRWAFYVSRSHAEANRLCLSEYIEMATECGSFAELVAHLRSGCALNEVEGLTVETGSQKSSRTFSPFAAVKPVKLGERLNASAIADAPCDFVRLCALGVHSLDNPPLLEPKTLIFHFLTSVSA